MVVVVVVPLLRDVIRSSKHTLTVYMFLSWVIELIRERFTAV